MKRKPNTSITTIILAAGKGIRMKSDYPKVLHSLCGVPMLYYPLWLVEKLPAIKKVILVLGFERAKVKEAVKKEFKNIRFAYQHKLNGSAKAVEAGLPYVDRNASTVLIMCGDSSFLDRALLKQAIFLHKAHHNDCTVLTKDIDSPGKLGRIIRDSRGTFLKIKEQVELSRKEERIKEVNTGIYLFKRQVLCREIKTIKRNPRKKEFFLTDIIQILKAKKYKLEAHKLSKDEPFFMINSLKDLTQAERMVRMYLIKRHLDRGVYIMDPETCFLGPKTQIGKDTIIYPFTFLENNVKIGNCCSVGPFAHIRPGSTLKDNSQVGNFTELVRSEIASFVKMKHLSYLGDTKVGKGVNIGAGTIVANYDGKKKHKTKISESSFIGSGTLLVAPVKVGKAAFTGAGSVVTKDVKPKTVVVGVPARKLKERKDV